MRQLTRLLRYVLPFGLQLLPGVLLLAAASLKPEASTMRPAERTRSSVELSAVPIATLRSAKNAPTPITAIAATLPIMKRARAALTRGGAARSRCCDLSPIEFQTG